MANDYRKLKYVRFYKDRVDVGTEGYNPQIILYYNSNDELVKVREEWRNEVWEQTISGTNMGSQTIVNQTYFDAWVKV
jgi:hypothetical protein